jgi:hypothetical protein
MAVVANDIRVFAKTGAAVGIRERVGTMKECLEMLQCCSCSCRRILVEYVDGEEMLSLVSGAGLLTNSH